jgi:hypothetical protein
MTEYEVNAQFASDVQAVLAKRIYTEFSQIREQEIKILTEICTRTNEDGEHLECKGNPITCRKIPPQFQTLTDGHYLVVGDYYFWTHASDDQKNAAIHRALSAIDVGLDKKGRIKLKTKKPEIQEFRTTITRFGAWNEPLVDAKEALKISANLFAEKQKAAA